MNDNKLIKISNEILNWKDSIEQGVSLLVDNGNCTPEFTTAIIESVEKFGPYFILMPKLALAHAAPGNYIKHNGLSLVVFKNEIRFSKSSKHNVQLLFTLAAKDETSHMESLMKFATLFQEDSELINKIISANDVKKIESELKGLI